MTISSENYNFVIEQDSDIESPRIDMDNLAKMVFFGKYKYMGDNHDIVLGGFDSRKDFMERGAKEVAKIMDSAICLPVHLYSHSGETISTSFGYPYNDRWDSGTCGFVVVTKDAIRKEYGVKRIIQKTIETATKIAIGEVETLNQWISGDIWMFSLQNKEGESMDMCGGFYGSDPKTNGMLDHIELEEVKAAILAD